MLGRVWTFLLGAAVVSTIAASAQADARYCTQSGSFDCNGFEGHQASWGRTGISGIDIDKGLQLDERNNGWVRASSGWNALWRFYDRRYGLDVADHGPYCTAYIWVRTSPNLTGGFFSVLDKNGNILSEKAFNALSSPTDKGYVKLSVTFWNPGDTYQMRIGFWGNGGDAWLQADDNWAYCTPIY